MNYIWVCIVSKRGVLHLPEKDHAALFLSLSFRLPKELLISRGLPFFARPCLYVYAILSSSL